MVPETLFDVMPCSKLHNAVPMHSKVISGNRWGGRSTSKWGCVQLRATCSCEVQTAVALWWLLMASCSNCLWDLVGPLCPLFHVFYKPRWCSATVAVTQRANRSRLHVQIEARPTVRTFIKTVREIKMVSAACSSGLAWLPRLLNNAQL